MASERKSLSEMVSETAREAGVLVLVFGMLDGLLDTATHDWTWDASIWVFGLALLTLGYVSEMRR
jgi:hypothetical protein